MTNFIRDSKRLHEGVLNALEEASDIIQMMTEVNSQRSLAEIQLEFSDWVEEFIQNKIVYAQDEMVKLGLELLSK